MKALGIRVFGDRELLGRLPAEGFVKPLPALGLSLVFKPSPEQTVEAEVLPTAAAGDGRIVFGGVEYFDCDSVTAYAALKCN